MGIPAGVTRVTLSGTLGTSEVWATSYYQTGSSAALTTDANAASQMAVPLFNTAVAHIEDILNNTDAITALDLYYYDGGTSAVAHGHASFNRPGASVSSHPKQIALCMTLKSALATRSGRGRMFFPATGIALGSNGLATPTPVDQLVDAWGDWFNELHDGTAPAVVVSQLTTSTHEVTSVSADYVPDTQRRRRNKLRSARHTATVG